jgi:uncharacterized surface protein with fasciclin (FAS1) repeats
MKRVLLAGALALAIAGCNEAGEGNATATANTSAPERPSGTIADAIGNGRFAQAAEAAGLKQTLSGAGPYTVLVPTDQAFAAVPQPRLQTLLNPAGKAELTRVLTFHVLPGTMLAADIGKAIDAGGGKTMLASLGGGTLTATRQGDTITVTDASGTRATVTGNERVVGNGVIHSIDKLLTPPTS